MTEIGRRPGRNKPGISRELKRTGNKDGSYYHRRRAASLYLYRRKASVRKPRLEEAELPAYVLKHPGEEYRRPPEAITARWNTGHPSSKLSHSTIYRAVNGGILKKAYPGGEEISAINYISIDAAVANS
jgi:IS30 family transposase